MKTFFSRNRKFLVASASALFGLGTVISYKVFANKIYCETYEKDEFQVFESNVSKYSNEKFLLKIKECEKLVMRYKVRNLINKLTN
jgi:hypothetical protein